MAPPLLADTLLALVDAIDDAPRFGVEVTEMDLTVPLEARAGTERGALVIRAGVPHTRWVSGFLPPVHLGRVHVALGERAPVDPWAPDEGGAPDG